MRYALLWELLLFMALLSTDTRGHPQCLDYFPPFRSARPKSLCKDTASYGCCTSQREASLQSYYDFVEAYGRKVGTNNKCYGFVKSIICAECHPYAAHIFDAETPPVVRTNFSKKSVRFPGLCYDFCMSSFEECRQLVMQLPMRNDFRFFVSSASGKDFCEWAIPGDNDYCYPSVKGGKTGGAQGRKQIGDNVLCVQPVAHLLSNPLAAVSPNDGSHRIFIAEQRGTVHIVDYRGLLIRNRPFLDIREKVLNSGQGWDERGLLGLAFHPKFSSNGRLFVYYSTSKRQETAKSNETLERETHWYNSPRHRIRIAEYIVSQSDPNVADDASEVILLEIDEPEANHEGGMILFGDDGFLYIFVGDGGGGGDDHWSIGNSLNKTNLLGKVLRIDVDVSDGRRYRIPLDNPFIHEADARPEIYAYGTRNMWRCSKDRGDARTRAGKGRIFCGDVGQNKFEEIDIIVKGGNYGWRAMEGNHCYDKSLCTSKLMKNYKPPIITYNHTIGKSTVGGYVYRGCQNPLMQGKYFYADTVSGRIFSANEDTKSGEWISEEVVMGNSTYCNNALKEFRFQNILSFGEDEAGELYIASVFWPEASRSFGTLYKLVDPKRRSDPEICKIKRRPPNVLRNIKKRRINGSQKVTGEYTQRNTNCIDKRRFCRHIKTYPWLCRKYLKFAASMCPKACNKCHPMFQ